MIELPDFQRSGSFFHLKFKTSAILSSILNTTKAAQKDSPCYQIL
jgi:hypothetical protein